MTQQEFESKMLQAKTMHDLGERPDYHAGYMRGLRRAYHGENFGTDEEHVKWMSLTEDRDEERRERGRGYQDGLEGKRPDMA